MSLKKDYNNNRNKITITKKIKTVIMFWGGLTLRKRSFVTKIVYVLCINN